MPTYYSRDAKIHLFTTDLDKAVLKGSGVNTTGSEKSAILPEIDFEKASEQDVLPEISVSVDPLLESGLHFLVDENGLFYTPFRVVVTGPCVQGHKDHGDSAG